MHDYILQNLLMFKNVNWRGELSYFSLMYLDVF
jgi:hypothetical protein